ncbi:hypothetical protein TcG_10743 [Trypanosoma cruzi]|nr:hypothetical protein TcG_10743 [Trypanosoma cruzi]
MVPPLCALCSVAAISVAKWRRVASERLPQKAARSVLERASGGAGDRRRAPIVSSRQKRKREHPCQFAAALTDVLPPPLSRVCPDKTDDPSCGNARPHTSWGRGCAPATPGWFGRRSVPPALRKQKTSHERSLAGARPPRQHGRSAQAPRLGGRRGAESPNRHPGKLK